MKTTGTSLTSKNISHVGHPRGCCTFTCSVSACFCARACTMINVATSHWITWKHIHHRIWWISELRLWDFEFRSLYIHDVQRRRQRRRRQRRRSQTYVFFHLYRERENIRNNIWFGKTSGEQKILHSLCRYALGMGKGIGKPDLSCSPHILPNTAQQQLDTSGIYSICIMFDQSQSVSVPPAFLL